MKSENEFLIESDIIIEHLVWNKEGNSTLESLMEKGVCYTTVLNKAEVYFSVKNEVEKK